MNATENQCAWLHNRAYNVWRVGRKCVNSFLRMNCFSGYLFLSFAKHTVARVCTHTRTHIKHTRRMNERETEERKKIDVDYVSYSFSLKNFLIVNKKLKWFICELYDNLCNRYEITYIYMYNIMNNEINKINCIVLKLINERCSYDLSYFGIV